ncbi:hypothetical protein BDY19DRAFT_907906 [Irpex rosettiformis]|uniref:Uncharacterized protein n=1 Tax=Irpex rosettiformis TaxID=378272 RepID=A0ACB8TYH3_9APHY|nr:hypothetical protein BDY19DRAFT_907906 [Irpex rosettiformis]
MPVTRSRTAAELTGTIPEPISDTMDEGKTLWDCNSKTSTRVIADAGQLVVLNALYEVSRFHTLTRQDFLKTSVQTGLTENWIRKWIGRKRNPRSKSAKLAASQSKNGESNMVSEALPSSQSDNSSSESSSASYENGITAVRNNLNLELSILSLLNSGSLRSVSAIRPDISRASSAPELYSSGGSRNAEPALNYGDVYAQLLAKSPSLGYIPSTFPLDAFLTPDKSPSLSSSTSSSASASDTASPRVFGTYDSLPVIPNLDVPSNVRGRVAIPSILDLLQDEPIDPAQKEDRQLYTTGFTLPESPQSTVPTTNLTDGYKSYALSFAPSMQSHSTSVMLNNTLQSQFRPPLSQSLSFQPTPIAFKARLSDLNSLSKRIRALSQEEFLAAVNPTRTEGQILC